MFQKKGLEIRPLHSFRSHLPFLSRRLFLLLYHPPFWCQISAGLSIRSYPTDDLRGKYISFCTFFIFGFGLTFELPLILALLSYLRVVHASFLTRNRRYAILIIAIAAAVITPTPDVFNMSLMGGPLYVLFEIGIILVKIIERKRTQTEAVPT